MEPMVVVDKVYTVTEKPIELIGGPMDGQRPNFMLFDDETLPKKIPFPIKGGKTATYYQVDENRYAFHG